MRIPRTTTRCVMIVAAIVAVHPSGESLRGWAVAAIK